MLPLSVAALALLAGALQLAAIYFYYTALDRGRGLRRTLPAILASAATFGLVNVLQKVVFNRTNFVTGYVFFTAGTFAAAMALLLHPSWRKQILRSAHAASHAIAHSTLRIEWPMVWVRS